MADKCLTVCEENVVETIGKENKGNKIKEIITWMMSNLKRTAYLAVLVVFTLISASLFIQNKIADAENDKLRKEMAALEDTNKALESKLAAAEQNRYDRVEVETVQIMKELSEASDLTTYEYEYINETTETNTRMLPILGWDILGTKNSVTIKYVGVINVGYDMSDIQYTVSKHDKRIYVTLPEAQVLDNYIKFDELTCICENNILNPIRTDAIMEYFEVIEADELAKAEADDIYGKADEQLKNIVSRYLGVFQDYEVVFN